MIRVKFVLDNRYTYSKLFTELSCLTDVVSFVKNNDVVFINKNEVIFTKHISEIRVSEAYKL